jgi:hypothetical protein
MGLKDSANEKLGAGGLRLPPFWLDGGRGGLLHIGAVHVAAE